MQCGAAVDHVQNDTHARCIYCACVCACMYMCLALAHVLRSAASMRRRVMTFAPILAEKRRNWYRNTHYHATSSVVQAQNTHTVHIV